MNKMRQLVCEGSKTIDLTSLVQMSFHHHNICIQGEHDFHSYKHKKVQKTHCSNSIFSNS